MDETDRAFDSEYIFVGNADMDGELPPVDDITNNREQEVNGNRTVRKTSMTVLEEIESSLTEELSKLQRDLDLHIDLNQSEDQHLNDHFEQHETTSDASECLATSTTSPQVDISRMRELLLEKRENCEAVTDVTRQYGVAEKRTEQPTNFISPEDGNCVLQISEKCNNKHLFLLPCLHCVCKACGDLRDNNTIRCKCGRDISLKMKLLPTDFVHRNETRLAKNKMRCGYLKDPCPYKVVSYCTNCNVSLCTGCQEDHGKIRVMSSHEIIPIEDVEKFPPEKRLKASLCVKHPEQPLLYLDKQCHQAICHLCLTGDHAKHEVNAIKSEYNKRKNSLNESLRNYEDRLQRIQKCLKDRQNRLSELQQCRGQLEEEMIEIHQNISTRYLSRLKDLLQELNNKSGQLQDAVREDIQSITAKEATFLTTVTYVNRCIESTTPAEFLELYDVVSRKISEDLQHPLVDDSTQGKYIVFSCRGQKALEELVEVFGDVTCTDKAEAREDDIITPSEIQEEYKKLLHDRKQLTDQLSIKEEEIETEIEAKKRLTKKLQLVEERVTHLQRSLGNIGLDDNTTPYPLMETAVKMSLILQCIDLKFDHKRANLKKIHFDENGHLLNTPESRPYLHGERRFQKFCGTSSTFPLHKTGGPQYLEVLTRVSIDKLLPENVLLMNIGLCREKDRDASHYIPPRQHCYSLEVGMCNKHNGACTRIWRDGNTVSHQSDTVKNVVKTQTMLHYGIVCDGSRGKIVFLDLKHDLVMSVLDDVNFSKSLWPMFASYKLEGLCVEMALVNGRSFEMTSEKKSMILKALA